MNNGKFYTAHRNGMRITRFTSNNPATTWAMVRRAQGVEPIPVAELKQAGWSVLQLDDDPRPSRMKIRRKKKFWTHARIVWSIAIFIWFIILAFGVGAFAAHILK